MKINEILFPVMSFSDSVSDRGNLLPFFGLSYHSCRIVPFFINKLLDEISFFFNREVAFLSCFCIYEEET